MKSVLVDVNNLKNNIKIIKDIAENTGRDDNGKKVKIIGVVKGNGMGLGLIEFSKFLLDKGIKTLAVATVEEAIALRKNGIDTEILMLSSTELENEIEQLINNKIIITVSNKNQIQLAEKIAKKLNIEEVKAHLKIDTGFGRYGFIYENKNEILEALKLCKKIKIEGTFTHFSKSIDEKWTNIQFERFINTVAYLKENKMDVGYLHCCNTHAFLKYKNMHLNAVRIGSGFLGRIIIENEYGLKKVGVLKTKVAEIKRIPKGYNISYANTIKTKRDSIIGVIPVGYADGFGLERKIDAFSFKEKMKSCTNIVKKIFKTNYLEVKIKDKKYKVLGRVGMFHSSIDITDTEIKPGDEVYIESLSPILISGNIRREYL